MSEYIDVKKARICEEIDKYFQDKPQGLDVTGQVLNAIGEAHMRSHAKSTKVTFDQAKQEMGRMISDELLPSMFHSVEKLGVVKVDPAVFPGLVPWVSSYTQHRVGARKKW